MTILSSLCGGVDGIREVNIFAVLWAELLAGFNEVLVQVQSLKMVNSCGGTIGILLL